MEASAQHGFGARGRRALALGLVAAFLAAGLALVWTISWNRAFQVDEVEHVHAAFNMRTGKLIYRDFRQSHPPLLYVVLQPVVDADDPVATFRRARGLTTALFTLCVGLCGLAAGRLSGLSGGLLAAGLALAHTTFVDRGLEVRTDGPMALCVAAALAVELSRAPRLAKYCGEAALLSAAFLFTNKAVFACFAFGCLWLAAAWRRRRLRLLALPMAVWILPLAAASAIMAAAGNLGQFIAINFGDVVGEVTRTAPHSRGLGLAVKFLAQESRHNLVFGVLAIAGWVLGALAWRRPGAPGGGLGFVAFLALVLFVSLFVNPFPYPYFHVTALPPFVVLAAVAGSRLGSRWGVAAGSAAELGLVFLLLAATATTSAPRLLQRAVRDYDRQLEVLRQIQRLTEPDDAVFDMAGLYFRPDASPVYLMTGNTLARYRLGRFPRIPATLRDRQAVAYVFNYRIAWLAGEEKAFLEQHFVHYDGNVFLLGSPLDVAPGESLELEVLKTKELRYDGAGAVLVDGRPFRRGVLERGPHRVTRVARRGPDRLILATPPPVPWPPRPPQPLYDFFQ